MSLIEILGVMLLGWLVAALLMVGMFAIQKRIGDAGVVDIAWSLGVVGVVILYAQLVSWDLPRTWLVVAVTALWGLRLSLHVFIRFLTMKPDGRYEKLKEEWGTQADRRMFRFYQMQAIGILIFSIPPLISLVNPNSITWLDYVAVGLAIIGVAGEGLADWQLTQFRRKPDNKGQVFQAGLWRYSRHPNYFFEWLYWWCFVAFSVNWAPWGWLTLLGPFFMWYFLTQVTGIPHTESQALRTRGHAYREYQRTTNAFFPWFPKAS